MKSLHLTLKHKRKVHPGQGLAMLSASYGLHHIRNRIFTLQINAKVGNVQTFRVESDDHETVQ